MLKAILFDIDGTLINSQEANRILVSDILQRAGYKRLKKNEYGKLVHLSLVHAIQTVTKTKGLEHSNKIISTHYNKITYRSDLIKIHEKYDEYLSVLKKYFKLGIVTSRKQTGVETFLKNQNGKKYFKNKHIVHLEHVKKPKPHPEPILLSLKKLAVKPSEAVYVGDTEADAIAGAKAKVKTIIINKKAIPGAHIQIKTFSSLLKAINFLNN